ncbi:MAG: electron transfer flavoprotein subunit alpha/FixB family protein [Spirochaetales bacterium]
MKRCLILREGDPLADLELLEVARLLYRDSPVYTLGLQLGQEPQVPSRSFDALVEFSGDVIPRHDVANLAAGIVRLHERYELDSILIPASLFGRMLAPRLAMRLGVGLVADVTALESDGELQMIRPAYSGRLMAGIVKKGPGPWMMTVRPNVFPARERTALTTERLVIDFAPRKPSGITYLGSREKSAGRDIRDSEILVSGGGGVLGQFSKLEALAQALGGQVSASRRVVDSGGAQRALQVGQSGKTVSPRLYLALGISGSVQHLEGLRNVEHLIVVNTDPDAPLCSLADMVVEGDALEFIERLVERIQLHKASGG